MEQVDKLKRTWNLAPVLQIVQRILENYFPCLYILIGRVWWLVVQKIYSEMHLVSCTNTHHDVADLVNHKVKNTKTWISWERNITFLRNKILNLCLGWQILRSYRFVIFKKLSLGNLVVLDSSFLGLSLGRHRLVSLSICLVLITFL